jgi:hypothetical protein
MTLFPFDYNKALLLIQRIDFAGPVRSGVNQCGWSDEGCLANLSCKT